MKHEEWQILVSAYHDGEVTPEEKDLVEAHLAECVECTETLAAYRRLGRTVQSQPRGKPSRDLWLRVREHLSTQRRGWALWRRFLPAVSAVATLVVAVTLTVTLWPLFQSPAPVSAPALERQSYAVPGEELQEAPSQPTAMPEPTVILGVPNTPTIASPLEIAGDRESDHAEQFLFLAWELVTLTVRSDAELSAPRLYGILLDEQDQPLPGATLVVSGTGGWISTTISGPNGSFALDLPVQGNYQILAIQTAEEPLTREATVPCISETSEPNLGVYKDWKAMDFAPIILGPSDEVMIVLRLR